MVVLNFYGSIKSAICISDKLKLYISNFNSDNIPEWISGWKGELEEELLQAMAINVLNNKRYNIQKGDPLIILYNNIFPNNPTTTSLTKKQIENITDKMVCIYFNYEYSDMPMGDWTTNCCDGRFCEEDYAEKIISFLNFLACSINRIQDFPNPTPNWIYSSNYDKVDERRLFWNQNKFGSDEFIKSLIEWGRLIDNFLQTENDYYQLDFLCNAIFDESKCDTYQYMKLFSLCQMFLENKRESELDEKLPFFLDERIDFKTRKQMAQQLRRIRNKIAHGDFKHFNNEIEKYAQKFLDGKLYYDYTEYSRQNWVLLSICCTLKDALALIIYYLLFKREDLDYLKKEYKNESTNN